VKHYLLTRSAYGPRVPLEVNRRRLDILRGVTARSLAAQTQRDVTWLVLIDPRDPLLTERMAVLESVGLPLLTAPAGSLVRDHIKDRPQGPWARSIDWSGPVLTSRIDDDDAYMPWALAAFQEKGEEREAHRGARMVWVLPLGFRVAAGRLNQRSDMGSQFATLYAPRGDRTTIMDINHTSASQLAPVRVASEAPAWLWLRHELARSANSGASQRHRDRMRPVPKAIRREFPVDWDLIEALA
jgi:hypothetical protein